MQIRKYFLYIGLLLITPIQGFAWSQYVVCNNGGLVIDYGYVDGARGSYLTSQYVIRDQGVVEYFKSTLPDLSLSNTHSESIFNTSNELLFVTTGSANNPYYQSDIVKASTMAQTKELFEEPYTTDDRYMVYGERIGNGVMIEFYKGSKKNYDKGVVIANWYFENCERVNTAYSPYDPLEFWYINH